MTAYLKLDHIDKTFSRGSVATEVLKEITLGFQQEQNQVTLLLQAIHNYVSEQESRQAQQPPVQQQPAYQQPVYQQPVYQQQPVYVEQPVYQQRSGFGGFMNSGFGQAIATGAGFAIGEDIINDIF